MSKNMNKRTRTILVATTVVIAIILVFTYSYYRQMVINDNLAAAVRNGKPDLVAKYLNEGGDPNLQVHESKNAPTTVERLRTVFHFPLPDTFGNYAMIDWACGLGDPTIIRLLLEKGADPNRHGNASSTPFNVIIGSQSMPMVKLFLDHGANINASSQDTLSPLHAAAFVGSPELTDLLIKRGANINYVSKMWSTAVTVAARSGHNEVVRHLIAAGADITIRGADGLLPSEVARKWGIVDCAALLEHAMAKRKTTPPKK